MSNSAEIQNRLIRHNPGTPRGYHRLRWDVTLQEAQAGLEKAEKLSPVVKTRLPEPTLKIDDVTREEDARLYPIYPHEALASVRLRRQIRTERGVVGAVTAIALGIGIAVFPYYEVKSQIATRLADTMDSALTYLQTPQNEEIQDFRRKADIFHSQR